MLGLIDLEQRWTTAALALIGIANAALVFWFLRTIRADIYALIQAIDPARGGAGNSE